MNDKAVYVCDVETTSIDILRGDIIEISFCRILPGLEVEPETRTWFLRAVNEEHIQPGALKVNKHVLEEITWKTTTGCAKYQDPKVALAEIENWIAEDGQMTQDRHLAGHNAAAFDAPYVKELFRRHGVGENYPFNHRVLDTMQMEFAMDWGCEKLSESYSLSSCIKKYGIKNANAHTAEADTIATKDLFLKQMARMKKAFSALENEKALADEKKG
jgi:DNA polymerase III epsilon subunit-like protein